MNITQLIGEGMPPLAFPLAARVDGAAHLLIIGGAAMPVDAILRTDGYGLTGAADLDAAWAAIALSLPCLIVLALSPSDHDGDAWLLQLKANFATERVPVLVISASVRPDANRRSLEAGADGWMMQPPEAGELRLRVRNLLRLVSTTGPDRGIALQLRVVDRANRREALALGVLDALPATIAVLDNQGVLVEVNQAWREFSDGNGLAPDYSFGIGKNYLEVCERACLCPDEGSYAVASGIRAVLSGAARHYSIEYPCHSPDALRWFLMTVSPLGKGIGGAVVMHLDVTQKYIAEQSLRDSEAQFRQMADNILEIFFLVDTAAWRVLYVSPAFEEIIGRSCASLYADANSWTGAMMPGDRVRVAAEYASHLLTGEARFDCNFQIERPDGKLRWIAMKVFAVAGADGVAERFAGVAQDITESKNAVRDLRESQHRFLELLNNTSLLSVMLDLDGNVTFCNEALLRLTGLQREAVIGSNWFDAFMLIENTAAKAYFRDLLADNAKQLRYEDEIVKVDGEQRLICWNISILRDRSGKVIGTASIGEDVTEQKKSAIKILKLNANLEKISYQLLHAQEQERISLARELHDELGQQLALLKIDLHHLRRFLLEPDAWRAWTAIDTAVVTLIGQIRVITVSLRPLSLDHLGLETALRQLLKRQFATGDCRCVFEYVGLPAKLAPPIEIAVYRIVQESITNIVRHAKATRVVVEINGGESGSELELIIRDNGVGVGADGIDAIDGSTRADGSHGGLAGMRERTELLGGSFNVDPVPGGGTRVSVALSLEPL